MTIHIWAMYTPTTDLEILRGINPFSAEGMKEILRPCPDALDCKEVMTGMMNATMQALSCEFVPIQDTDLGYFHGTLTPLEHIPEASPETLIFQLSETFPGYAFYLHMDDGQMFVAKNGEADLWQTP